jgi:hypothetical protein
MELTWTTGQVALGSLIEYDKNPVQISKRDAQELAKSLKKFGHIIPYTAAAPQNGDAVPILDGHQRKKVEMEILKVSPDTLVDVRFPSRALTEKERQEAIIRLRKNTGEFDPDALLNWFEADDLKDWGFDEKELQKIGYEFGGGGDAEPEIDRAAELLEKWGVKPGDLWQIGEHRLICGDCTDAATVARVMGGERALLVTDPPYGIDLDSSWQNEVHEKEGKALNYNTDKIQNDSGEITADLFVAWDRRVVFGFPYLYDPAATGWFVWDKEPNFEGKSLTTPIEMAYSTTWTGFRKLDLLWSGYMREEGSEKKVGHPTQKPLKLIDEIIKAHEDEVVADLFSGSGTTLVACENLRRRCRAIEISPAYVAVALERMSQAFEGIEIKRI